LRDEVMEDCVLCAQRISELTQTLVGFGKPTATREIVTEPAADVATEALRLVRHLAGPRSELHLTAETDAYVTHCQGEIHQILVNLLRNAIDQVLELERGRVELLVEALGDGSVEFRVDDNGPGVPVELQSQLFEAFRSTRHGKGGSGLGLYVSARVARSLGGELRCGTSLRLGGASFCLRVPPSLPMPAPKLPSTDRSYRALRDRSRDRRSEPRSLAAG
jgi:signal transduction histidine kinase